MGEAERLQALATLRYDPDWWRFGFLDKAFLQGQLDAFQAGADTHTEHYRYAAFLHILHTATALDDRALAHLVDLAERDPDRTMATSALLQLVWWPGLTPAQRAWLRDQPALAAPVIQRAFARQQQR